jgi:hypothetical protein
MFRKQKEVQGLRGENKREQGIGNMCRDGRPYKKKMHLKIQHLMKQRRTHEKNDEIGRTKKEDDKRT